MLTQKLLILREVQNSTWPRSDQRPVGIISPGVYHSHQPLLVILTKAKGKARAKTRVLRVRIAKVEKAKIREFAPKVQLSFRDKPILRWQEG